jgi:acetyl esterase/lipase
MREADAVARELVNRIDLAVISVGYHLADETNHYPNLHREMKAAVTWTRRNAGWLNVDPNRISLGGASAGANLSVAAALQLRDAGIPPHSLVLAYPTLHDPSPVSATDVDLTLVPELLRLRPASLTYMYQRYRGGAMEAPLLTVDGHDLAGLPPTLLLLAQYDDLLGSGEAFASLAIEAGVEVTQHLYEGAVHGFLNFTPAVSATADAYTRMADFLRG